MNSLAGW